MKRFLFLFLGALFLISFTSAISVSNSNLVLNDTLTSTQIQFNQVNITTTVSISLDSNLQGKLILSTNSLTVFDKNNLTVNLASGVPSGNYFGYINWNANDGTSGSIPIFISIGSTSSSGCQLNPSIVTYTQSVQQGTQFDLPQLSFNPTGCNGSFSIQSAYVTGGVTTSSGQKPVFIKTAGSNTILLGVDTIGLSSQTYTTKLTMTAFGKTFSDVATINIIVTTGTDPTSNFSLSQLPICSLTNNLLATNSSYSLICSNIQPDVTIQPVSDSAYIIGTGVQTTQTQYIWSFTPVSFGSTNVSANFFYKGSPVGSPFRQIVKITSNGASGSGTNLAFLFTPDLSVAQAGQSVIVQLIDNKSSSLVANAQIFVDAKLLNSTDGYTFYYSFDSDHNYSFRGKSSGYDDLVQNIFLQSKPIQIFISPSSGDSLTYFNISTGDVNASLFINGNKVSNPTYQLLSAGNNSIEAIAQGYNTNKINFSVDPGAIATLQTDFKKGSLQTISLSKNASWLVNLLDTKGILKPIINGTGDKIVFTPEESGTYTVYVSSSVLWSGSLSGWDGKIFKLHWFWWICIIVAILFLIVISRSNRSQLNPHAFSSNVNLQS